MLNMFGRKYHIRSISERTTLPGELGGVEFGSRRDAKRAISEYVEAMPCPGSRYEFRDDTRIRKM